MRDFKSSLRPVVTRLKTRLGMTAPSGPAGGREALEDQERKLRQVRQRVAAEEERLEALRENLALARREAVSPGATGGAPVFFLTGRAKSGTSWLMRMLDAHPEVLCKGEGLFFGRGYLRQKYDGEGKNVTVQRTSLYSVIADSEPLRAWVGRSVWTRGDDVEEHMTNLTSLATEYFLKARLAESGKKIVGDKTPFTGTEFVREVATIRPDAKLIHIIRDGRDVAVSSMHHLWKHSVDLAGHLDLKLEEVAKRDAYHEDPQGFLETGESLFVEERIRSLARNWAEVVGRARKDGPELLGENYAEVRYEDLLARPEEELGRLLRFLGADASEGVVGSCVEAGSFERWSKGRERGQEDSVSLLRKGVAGDWRNAFTERDREIFKEEANDLLVELGYEKVRDW
jgi:hypothetical protein